MDRPAISECQISREEMLRLYLSNKLGREAARSRSVMRRPAGAVAPLSLAQEPIFRRAQRRDLPLLYNESVTIHRAGQLDLSILERVVAEIIRRHEAWRTTFELADGQPVQIIHEPTTVHIPTHDLRHLLGPLRETEAIRVGEQDSRQDFDLRSGPLVRFRLVRLGAAEFRLYITLHQMVCDGVSLFRIFLSELALLYDAFACCRPSPLPELRLQYGDYAYWQRRAHYEELSSQRSFWRDELAGKIPVLQWPTRPRPLRQSFRGYIHPFTLSGADSKKIKMRAATEGVTLFTFLIAALAAVLCSYTGQDELILGTASPAGRRRSEFQDLVGYFLNPVCLRMKLSGNPQISELLRRARDVLTAAISRDDVPLETLAEQMTADADPSRHPFFTVAASLEPPLAHADGWSLTPMDLQTGGARWDAYVIFDDRASGMLGRVQYNPDLLDAREIEQLIADLTTALEIMSGDPARRLSDVKNSISHAQVESA